MQPSIDRIKASNGAGNASVVTIQNDRAPLATTIIGDTTQGLPETFFASMGTPHTFIDPVTSEEITVISEETAVDFAGHIDGGNLEIDEIAPGYTDIGSEVGDIVIIRPTTQYADNIADVLDAAHNDDGTLKDTAIVYNPLALDHVASGAVWTGDAYGSTRAASMTAGVLYINGKRYTLNAVTARLFTASKDTYIDAPVPASGSVIANADLIYTEVANNAASPALAVNRIRLGIVITGAGNIANVAAINQGQEDKVLPIASSIPYAVTDSLGNLICPRDSQRRTLAYRQLTGTPTTTSSVKTTSNIEGLFTLAKVPTGRKIKVTLHGGAVYASGTARVDMTIYEGTVAGGVKIASGWAPGVNSSFSAGGLKAEREYTPSSSNPSFQVGWAIAPSGTATIETDNGASPMFLRVELV